MEIELDPLDDIFADETVKNARAAGKFQPKAKFRPAKKGSAVNSIKPRHAAQTSDAANIESREPVSKENPSEQNDQWSSGLTSPLHEKDPTRDISTATDNSHSSFDFVPDNSGGWSAHIEKSVGENADIFIGLEALGDFLPHTSADIEDSIPPSEAVALNVSNPEKGGGLDIPGLSSFQDSNHSCTELSRDMEPLTAEDPVISRTDAGIGRDSREFEKEEMDVMDSIYASESATVPGQKAGKFRPKPKIQRQKELCEAGSEPACQSFATEPVSPQIDVAEKNSSPAFEHDDMLDLSSIGFSHTEPSEAAADLPLNEESMNLMETTQLDSDMHLESGPEIPAKLASRRAKTATSETPAASAASLEQQEAGTSGQENEFRRSLRPRKSKTNLSELIDTAEDEVFDGGDFTGGEEENPNNEEFQEESESQPKKVKRKPRKSNENKGQPAGKRKKPVEASEKDAQAKPKKFAHSTRRRRVDKVLLETPEDEIDYQKVPLRDLILLAEHKERQMKKEAATTAPATTQSNGTFSGYGNEDEPFSSRQGVEHENGEGNPMVEETTAYFNYQTYMDRTPSTRWSKQETELFYEAIRQFGTDLSMMLHLFPGRTRRQLKLKYKKEERQHLFRLHEALSSRPKDTSHFKTVIERLQQIAAEEKQNADKDESIDLTGNEEAEEGTSHANDEEAIGEHVDEEENGGGEGNEDVDLPDDQVEMQNSFKSDESDDDLLAWGQYKSDL